MITFLIVLITIILIAAVLFVSWFFILKANGKCPVCAIRKITIPRQITMEISEDDDFDNKVAKTPPMGWSSWNTFRNHIDQDLIMETAHALVDSGLSDAGYKYLNLDDCWQSSMRDEDGKLQGDLKTFSRGIPELIKDINSLGLKAGLYSSNGTHTCEDMPASLGREVIDAKTMASWGCEFFKYDFCHNSAISGDCPAIEKIELNKIDGNSFNSSLVLNPNDAVFSGKARIVSIKDLPSGKAIGFINHGAGAAEFTFNTLPKGKYCLTVVHHKTHRFRDSYAQIVVNGVMHEIFFPHGNGFSDSGRTQFVVDLKDGENVIKISNPIATLADSSYVQYRRMGNALKNAARQWAEITHTEEKPIVFSICEWGASKPWIWGKKAGNMWRTNHDIFPTWGSIVAIYNSSIKLYNHAGPGGWNDSDMLEVGNGKLTEDENKAHFSLWCMMASPLILGNDIRKFVDGNNQAVEGNAVLKIVKNKQLIAIDQDPLGKPAKLIKKITGVDIIARPLLNGDVALCLFNKSARTKNIHLDISDLASDQYLLMRKADEYELHELWTDKRANAPSISTSLPKHSVQVYRIKTL